MGLRKKGGEWRIGEQRYAITSRGSRLEGEGGLGREVVEVNGKEVGGGGKGGARK